MARADVGVVVIVGAVLLFLIALGIGAIARADADQAAKRQVAEREFREWCVSHEGRVIWRPIGLGHQSYQDCVFPPKAK